MSQDDPTNESLTLKEAYSAMFCFLDAYYLRGKSDEIGGMLGYMSLTPDGLPADLAVWSDWLEAVQRAKDDPTADHMVLYKP